MDKDGSDGRIEDGDAQPLRRAGGSNVHRRRILVCLVIAGALFVVGSTISLLRVWPIRRFGEVSAGQLYRSRQPTKAEWHLLKKLYDIKTVIDLRHDEPNEPWSIIQREFCRDNDMELIRVPVSQTTISDEHFRQLMGIMTDPNYHPVLIHCEHGRFRTGIMVAAYRILIDGWTADQALEENLQYRPEGLGETYTKQLREIEAGTASCLGRKQELAAPADGPNS